MYSMYGQMIEFQISVFIVSMQVIVVVLHFVF